VREDRSVTDSSSPEIALRPAYASDEADVTRVAQLDSRRLPPTPLLVASRDGRIEAAISLDDGAVVANPFVPTADLVRLLRVHRRAMRADATPSRRRLLRLRPVGSTA
jgi:hypothetical protein